MVILNKHVVVVVIKICAIKLVLITGKLTVLIFLLNQKANPLPLSLRLPPGFSHTLNKRGHTGGLSNAYINETLKARDTLGHLNYELSSAFRLFTAISPKLGQITF